MSNKIDLLKPEHLSDFSKSIQESFNVEEKDIFFISAAPGEGIKELLNALEELISKDRLDLT